MANPDHLARLKEGVDAWNQWRESNPSIKADLSGANLVDADLSGANLVDADLSGANLSDADLSGANLTRANLGEAKLIGAYLVKANFVDADLTWARLIKADVMEANFSGANLSKASFSHANATKANLDSANLTGAYVTSARFFTAYLSRANLHEAHLNDADLSEANLSQANLSGADLSRVDLTEADLSAANLKGANFTKASLVDTNLEGADLTGCNVYGISVWNARLDRTKQSNLLITPEEEPAIRVDNLEVAQFVYLLLNNAKIRHVIDTITSKVVLILGRFTPERKVVLDAIREELRKRDYVPILFDFEKPLNRDLTGTITTLANMARFVIADLTDPSSIPHELAMVAPGTVVPIQPILLEGQREYPMFVDIKKRYHWVLEPFQYKSVELLLGQLADHVIVPAEAKAHELTKK